MTGVVVQAFVGERFHGTYRRYNGDRHVLDSASNGHAVESLSVPLIRSGVVAPPDKGGVFDNAPAVGAGHVDHHCDPVHDASARHVPRQIAAAHCPDNDA